MQGISLDEGSMAGWEQSLQTLFQSLLEDWENPRQAKKSEDLAASAKMACTPSAHLAINTSLKPGSLH
jgi:hypothetical protein